MRIAWLFSLIRSGSSVTAYSAAAPWGYAVADEPFGPWDRTGEPYHYPPEHLALMKHFSAAGYTLDAAARDSATRLFRELGQASGGVVVKIPHRNPTPEKVAAEFPGHRFAYLLRNPLHRLNSLHVRGLLSGAKKPIGPNHGLAQFKSFARRWLAQPDRVLYDDLQRDPRRFFGTIYRAWAWEHTDADLEKAAEYARKHYHAASKKLAPRSNPQNVVSVARWALPDDAIETYLSDPFVVDLMNEVGWSTRGDDYRAIAPPIP